MPWCFTFGSDGLHGRFDGAAMLMSEHDDEADRHNIDRILDASQAFIVDHVACYPKDEQIAETFIKDDFGWHTRIGATENGRKRMLTLRQFCAPFCRLLAVMPRKIVPAFS